MNVEETLAENELLQAEVKQLSRAAIFYEGAWRNELARNVKCGVLGGVGPNAAHECRCVLRDCHGGTSHYCADACGRTWS